MFKRIMKPRIISKVRYDMLAEILTKDYADIVQLKLTKGGETYLINNVVALQEVFLADDVILYREWRT